MQIEGLIDDLSKICESYLTKEEQIYIKKEWDKFNQNAICDIAARNGWLDLLMWASEPERNYHWDSWIYVYAVENGHLDILKWLTINCKILRTCQLCCYAAMNGHLDILKWMIKNDYKFDSWTCMYAEKYEYPEISDWLENNGCACDGRYHKNQSLSKKIYRFFTKQRDIFNRSMCIFFGYD